MIINQDVFFYGRNYYYSDDDSNSDSDFEGVSDLDEEEWFDLNASQSKGLSRHDFKK